MFSDESLLLEQLLSALANFDLIYLFTMSLEALRHWNPFLLLESWSINQQDYSVEQATAVTVFQAEKNCNKHSRFQG
jgi:hypothetical protein